MQMRVRIVLRGAEALKAFQLGLFGGETHVAEKGKRRGFSGDPTHGGKLTPTKKTTSGGVTRTYYTAPEAAPAGQPGLQPAQPQQPAQTTPAPSQDANVRKAQELMEAGHPSPFGQSWAAHDAATIDAAHRRAFPEQYGKTPAAAQRVPDGVAPPDPKDSTRVDFSQRRSTDAELDYALKRHGGNVRQAAKFIRDGEPGNAHHADLEQRLLDRVKASMPPEQREAIERATTGAQEHDAQADKHRQAAADWGGRDTPEGKAHLVAQSAHRSAADAHRNSLNGPNAKTDAGSPEQAQKAAEKARAATAKAPHLDPVQHHHAEMGKHHEAAQRLAKAPIPNLAAVTAHIRARDIHEAAAGIHRRGSTPEKRTNASANARAASEAAQMAEHGAEPTPANQPAGTTPKAAPAGKSVKLSGAASSEFDMLREQHADPEGHGLDDDEREAVGHLVSHHDPDSGHLRLPDDPEVADKMAQHVGAMASSYGDQIQDKTGEASHAEGRAHVKRAMGALEGLRDTLNTHAQGLRSKVATGAADTKRQEHEQKAAAHAAEAAKLPAEDPVGAKHREAAAAHEKAARWHGNVGKVGGAERAAAILSEQAHERTRDVDTVKQRMGERNKTRQAEDPAYRAAQVNAQQRQAAPPEVAEHQKYAADHEAKANGTNAAAVANRDAVDAHKKAAELWTKGPSPDAEAARDKAAKATQDAIQADAYHPNTTAPGAITVNDMTGRQDAHRQKFMEHADAARRFDRLHDEPGRAAHQRAADAHLAASQQWGTASRRIGDKGVESMAHTKAEQAEQATKAADPHKPPTTVDPRDAWTTKHGHLSDRIIGDWRPGQHGGIEAQYKIATPTGYGSARGELHGQYGVHAAGDGFNGADPSQYRVTHLPSGMAVGPEMNRDQAHELAKTLDKQHPHAASTAARGVPGPEHQADIEAMMGTVRKFTGKTNATPATEKPAAALKTTKTPKGGRTGHVQAIMDEVIKPALDDHAKHPDNTPAGQESHRGNQLMAQHFNAETESFGMPHDAKDAHDLAEALREYARYARSYADEAENRGDRAYHNTAAKHLDEHAKQMQAHADTLGKP